MEYTGSKSLRWFIFCQWN